MIGDVLEALVRYAQSNLTKDTSETEDKTFAISCAALFREWKPGAYKAGDIRTKDNVPYECILEHDSTVNTDWTIDVRTLWKPYHSRRKEWALPFEQPTGSYDMYLVGEYMVFNGSTYLCKEDTSYSPADYMQAWELAEE